MMTPASSDCFDFNRGAPLEVRCSLGNRVRNLLQQKALEVAVRALMGSQTDSQRCCRDTRARIGSPSHSAMPL